MLVSYRPLSIIAFALDSDRAIRCPVTRGVGREVSGQASKKGLREHGAATTRQNRGGQISYMGCMAKDLITYRVVVL